MRRLHATRATAAEHVATFDSRGRGFVNSSRASADSTRRENRLERYLVRGILLSATAIYGARAVVVHRELRACCSPRRSPLSPLTDIYALLSFRNGVITFERVFSRV